MGPARFELATSCSGGKRSIQLSYGPVSGGKICATARLGATRFIECGPGAVLAGLARRTERDWQVVSLSEAADLAQA